MWVKANCSFCGELTMYKGETRDVTDSAALSDLITAGYVERCDTPAPAEKAVKKDENKRSRRTDG